MIAALYIETGGVYDWRDDVDAWDAARDARFYAGPYPVVAHPPCERWGRYWSGGPMLARTPRAKRLGDDAGCFAAALAAVRAHGGVLEHPEASHAWAHHGLSRPPRRGGWVRADDRSGWTCCVEQGHYGHKSRKATWLYAAGVAETDLPALCWGASAAGVRIDPGYHSREERARLVRLGTVARLSRCERRATPPAFADVLIDIALRCYL